MPRTSSKTTTVDPDAALAELRRICSSLPGTTETQAWGHPNFKTGGRTYAVLEKYKGAWCIAVQAPAELRDHLLEDARFYATPYVGHRGWVSMLLGTKTNWREVRRLVTMSHELVGATPARKPRATTARARSSRRR